MRRQWLTLGVLLACLVLGSTGSHADTQDANPEQDTADETSAPGRSAPGAIYIPLKPAFVVNYGGPGRLRFLKADIAVRLANNQAATALRHHMPYVRNNLILLFSAQTDESLSSQEGREALRREALREVRDVLLREEHQEGIIDLYFNNFLVQN